MKLFLLLMIIYVACFVHTLPIISKPLEKNPDHLVWEALLTIDTHRSDDKTRKIPKSIFITPILGNCPPDHKLGSDGKCYKTLKIDPVDLLKSQIEFLFRKNKTATTEYVEDYDYSEYGESTEAINSSSNSAYTVPLSLSFPSEDTPPPIQHTTTFTHLSQLNRVVKDGAHGINHSNNNNSSNSNEEKINDHSSNINGNSGGNKNYYTNDNANKPFLVSTVGLDLDPKKHFTKLEIKRIPGGASVATSTIPLEAAQDSDVAATVTDDATETSHHDFVVNTQNENTAADSDDSVATDQTASQSESSTSNYGKSTVMDTDNRFHTKQSPLVGTTEDSTEISSPASFTPFSLPIIATTTTTSTVASSTPEAQLTSSPAYSTITAEDWAALGEENGSSTFTATAIATETTTPTIQSISSTPTTTATASAAPISIFTVLPVSPVLTTSSATIITAATATTEKTTPIPITTIKSPNNDVPSTESVPNTSPAASITAEPFHRTASDPIATDETASEYDEPKFPVLSQIGEIDKILMDLSDNASKIVGSLEQIDTDMMTSKQQDDEYATETSPESTSSLSSGAIVVLPENSTSNAEVVSNEQNRTNNTIDAYYIVSPSKHVTDRIDDAWTDPNTFTIDGKYRLENVSVVTDDEWPNDDPHTTINNSDDQPNIELVEPINWGHSLEPDDETKNLTARLAEDLLIRDPLMGLSNVYELAMNATTDNDDNNSNAPLELDEAARYPFGSVDEATTMESIEPPADIIIVRSKNGKKNDDDNRTKTTSIDTLIEMKSPIRMGTDSMGQPAQRVNSKASVYTTFINRLKPMLPFAELQLPDAIRRRTFAQSPKPMVPANDDALARAQADTTSVDESTDGQFMADEPTQTDPVAIVEQPPVDGKPSQLGINCYLRPLVNKQYFIVCK